MPLSFCSNLDENFSEKTVMKTKKLGNSVKTFGYFLYRSIGKVCDSFVLSLRVQFPVEPEGEG